MFIHCSADKCVYMMLMSVAPSAQHKLVLQHLILFPLKQSLLAQALPPPQLITLTRANRTNAHFCQSGWLGQGLKKGLSRPKQDTWSPYHSLPHKGSELCWPFSWHCCLPLHVGSGVFQEWSQVSAHLCGRGRSSLSATHTHNPHPLILMGTERVRV